ncbi:uncharacterized protein LOC119188358 [Manduca sexta]|uniref:uncharacterized protein LOC119188358 n=1 Tax=Manduca sexta TaxID=7130 RepID=UPI001890A2AF|nr:uncharacterized protein LOC119188358 [Manduca sexta]
MSYEEDTDTAISLPTLSVEAESRRVEHEFIKAYQRLPLLWDMKHPDYSNKYKRNIALDKLLIILKKLNHLATRYNVRQKINILRSCYRKDLRRHLASKVIGPDGEVTYEYVPNSWKFHKLRFLDGNEKNDLNINKSDIAEVNIEENSYGHVSPQASDESLSEHDNDEEHRHEITIDTLQYDKSFVRRRNPRKRVKLEVNNDHYYEISNDKEELLDREFDAIGSNVACKLKRMNQQQRCHAELLINKVLIKGLKNSLTDDTDITDVWNV